MLITDLWSSTDESVWKDAEKNYWKQVKPQNHSVEERLDTLDWHMIQNESVDEFYRFLHDDYFAWKFTDCRFLKTNRTRLSDQYRESREKLDEIQRLLFSFDTDDIDRGLKIVKGISGIGTSAGSGLLALLFPDKFCTVDRFLVNNLRSIKSLSESEFVASINPQRIGDPKAVFLIKMIRNKANLLNATFSTDYWIPRKIDKVLWGFRG